MATKVRSDSAPSKRRRSDGELTRKKVLDAAVESILEVGYYQTSSNQIARRAGVTWGTLQHQFGTREALLLEVLNEEWDRMQAVISVARAEGDTLEERLSQMMTILSDHYGSPTHLALLEILIDLTQNPNASAETRKAAMAHGRRLVKAWQPLFAQALGDAASEKEIVTYAFKTMRGYLMGDAIASRVTRAGVDDAERRFVIRGVAAAVREEARARGIKVQ